MKHIFTLFCVAAICSTSLFSQEITKQDISKLLDKRGRIRPGMEGSFDAKGYTMTRGKNG